MRQIENQMQLGGWWGLDKIEVAIKKTVHRMDNQNKL